MGRPTRDGKLIFKVDSSAISRAAMINRTDKVQIQKINSTVTRSVCHRSRHIEIEFNGSYYQFCFTANRNSAYISALMMSVGR